MHCIDDKAHGIILNYSTGWRGETRIAWYTPSERRDPGPLPASLREGWCEGRDLIAGRLTLLRGDEPPPVITARAVALAVEAYLCGRMMIAVENLSIDQDQADRTPRQRPEHNDAT